MRKLVSKLSLFLLVIVGVFVSGTYAQSVKEVTLLSGSGFKSVVVGLVGGEGHEDSIMSFIKADNMEGSTTTGEISVENSEYPVYVWDAGQGHIYYYTEADKIYMNSDSSSMFADMTSLENLDISNRDASNVETMSTMFYNCSRLTSLDLSNWNTSNVTNTNGMFAMSANLTTIYASSGFVVSQVTNSGGMFATCNSLVGGDGTTYDADHINGDYARIDGKDGLPGYFTDIADYTEKFDYTLLLPGQDFDGVLKTIVGRYVNGDGYRTTYASDIDIGASSFTIQRVGSIPAGAKTGVISVAESEFPVIAGYNGDNVIYYYTQADTIYMNPDSSYMFYTFPLGNYSEDWDTSKVTNMSNMFYGCLHLENLDLSGWDTSKVTDMSNMFNSLGAESIDLSSWDTSKVTDMSNMFTYTQLTTIYVKTGFMMNQVTNSDLMFEGSENLEGGNGTKYDSSHQDKTYARIDKEGQPGYFTEKLDYTMLLPGNLFNTEIKKLAGNASANYDSNDVNIMEISKWTGDSIPTGVTIGIISMKGSDYPVYAWYSNGMIYYYTKADKVYMNPDSSYMFLKLKRLGSINVDFDTSKVTNMRGMFQNDISLNSLDLSDWNTSRVTNMQEVFQMNTGLVELDLSNWDASNVTNMGRIFDNCVNLRTIYVKTGFVTSQLADNSDYQMFSNDDKLVGGNGTKYNSGYNNKTYALIDKAGQSGYFTDKNAITVKFISTLDGTETNITTSKGHQVDNVPNVKGYTVKGVYSDEAMTKPIDLSKGVDGYTQVYVKYESNGGGGGGGGGSSGGGGRSSGSSSTSDKNKDTNDKNIDKSEKDNETGTDIKSDTSKNDRSENTQNSQKNNNTSSSSINSSDILSEAYYFAFRNGITTKTRDNAKLYSNLTRIQMAKMLSKFAINILGKSPDTSKGVARFSDVSSQLDKQYDNAVTLAYQLGIMGVNVSNNRFRPNDIVTRAEFVTALSRLLYSTSDGQYKSTGKYYEPHMARLYSQGIITNKNPKLLERRGYVMLMLMRSVQ